MVDHKSCRYVKSSISWGPASHSSTTERRLEISALNFSKTGQFLYIYYYYLYMILFVLCSSILSMPKYAELKLCSLTYR